MRAIRIHQRGGPEVMTLEEIPTPTPGPGQARIRIATAGVNYRDVGDRSAGPQDELPVVLGSEAAGVVEAIGPDVEGVEVGDRVAFCMQLGAYAEQVVLDADTLMRVPHDLGLDLAAAVLLQGMTAHYLLKDTVAVQPGDRILVHAGAGGAGSLLVQLGKHLGCTVYATVSTDEKEAYVRSLGADEVIRYDREDVAERVRELTGGRGVRVVYDSVGRDTFEASLRCLQRRGCLALFGHSSGQVEGFAPGRLSGLGSLYVTRPTLKDHMVTPEERRMRSSEVFGWAVDGVIDVRIHHTYPLAGVVDAHRDLEGRRTMGKLLVDVTS